MAFTHAAAQLHLKHGWHLTLGMRFSSDFIWVQKVLDSRPCGVALYDISSRIRLTMQLINVN